MQELDRTRTLKVQVPRSVDNADATFAERCVQPIDIVEHVAAARGTTGCAVRGLWCFSALRLFAHLRLRHALRAHGNTKNRTTSCSFFKQLRVKIPSISASTAV
jgi:hypothetical protein